MKVLETCSLDNTVCEHAAKQGYTHIRIDGRLFKIVDSEKFGYDWIMENSDVA